MTALRNDPKRKETTHYSWFVGTVLALFVIGCFMSLVTLATCVPMLPTAWQHGREVFLNEVMALAAWLLPSFILAFLGWILRIPSIPTH